MDANTTYAFNGATKALGINEEREAFHGWCKAHRVFDFGREYTLRGWLGFFDSFLSQDDAQDLADTQTDSLSVPF